MSASLHRPAGALCAQLRGNSPGIARVEPPWRAGFAAIGHRRPDGARLRALTGYRPRHDLDATLRAMAAASRAGVG